MKLILAIIQAADEADSVQELNKRGFFVTKLSTTGGFLKAKNTTLPAGANMVEVPAGGCVVFVLDIDKAQKF